LASAQAIVFSAGSTQLPFGVQAWLEGLEAPVVRHAVADDVFAFCIRSRPRVVVLDGRRGASSDAIDLLKRLKSDSFTGVIPAIMVADAEAEPIQRAFAGGADEVISSLCSEGEAAARLDAVLRRSDRDLQVHPSTRLPGAVAIDAEIARRMALGEAFAACYADLDYFKEFNDRYSYYQGDRVILIVSQILHDAVRGLCGRAGFVGHIGGDDFILVIPIEVVPEVCTEIIAVFDALIPLQYSEQDRRAGYFFGKDRRGQLHRVPLMSVSIGVVTTERRRFTHAAQVSALATEMKSYAKTLPGSVFSIDRRQDEPVGDGSRSSGPIRLISPPMREGGTS
jgi:GGDEF domain-containing protein